MGISPLQALWNRKNLWAGLLLIAVVVSALAVSYSAYESRRLHNQLQQALEQRNRAQVEWGRLLLESSTLTSPGRIEQLARDKLNMATPQTSQIEMVMP